MLFFAIQKNAELLLKIDFERFLIPLTMTFSLIAKKRIAASRGKV